MSKYAVITTIIGITIAIPTFTFAQNAPRKPRIEDTIKANNNTQHPRVESIPTPKDWHTVGFDDSQWANAKEFTEEQVRPKTPFFKHDFKGAKFIWSDNIKLDNIVLFRTVVKSPPDGKERPDFRGLTDVVPQGGGQREGKRRSERKGRNNKGK